MTNNFTSLSSEAFVDAVTAQISLAASVVDLNFGSTFFGDGLSITYTCTDVLGCNDVPGGSSRTFEVSITGMAVGDYKFDVFARGIDAIESDLIHVTAVPEPETYAMLLAGLGLIGFIAHRRKIVIV
ncbi:FxDxF family PEP-CTERM protein [Nitrosomonas supralitoralis]|nr:FxDxF family PEP-CTERM protein [Nitrosomonas supralitoralis]